VTQHEQLWAPWRLAYISGQGDPAGPSSEPEPLEDLKLRPGADPECFLCRAAVSEAERENLVVERTELSLVILNRFPYNNGHLLVSPLAHQGRLDELAEHEQVDLQRLMSKYVGIIERTMDAQGFNIGLNLGRVAGAGVPGHLHWHIVPRWHGDTNFMPALANVRVIPQSLDALWQIVRDAQSPRGPSTSA
jgi:ATP adenylyltransferase